MIPSTVKRKHLASEKEFKDGKISTKMKLNERRSSSSILSSEIKTDDSDHDEESCNSDDTTVAEASADDIATQWTDMYSPSPIASKEQNALSTGAEDHSFNDTSYR